MGVRDKYNREYNVAPRHAQINKHRVTERSEHVAPQPPRFSKLQKDIAVESGEPQEEDERPKPVRNLFTSRIPMDLFTKAAVISGTTEIDTVSKVAELLRQVGEMRAVLVYAERSLYRLSERAGAHNPELDIAIIELAEYFRGIYGVATHMGRLISQL